MTLIEVLLAVCLIGVLLWLVNSLLPMEERVKTILNIIVIVALVVWLFQVFHLGHYLPR